MTDTRDLKALSEVERWKSVVGWQRKYEVSNFGKIRKLVSGNPVGTWLSDQGYEMARLSSPRKNVRVHSVVASAFWGKQNGKVVNHINHIRDDNRLSNLEWVTQAENLSHMTICGRRSKHWLGRRSPNARLSEDEVSQIKSLRTQGLSYQIIADAVGCSKRTVQRIIKGQSYV